MHNLKMGIIILIFIGLLSALYSQETNQPAENTEVSEVKDSQVTPNNGTPETTTPATHATENIAIESQKILAKTIEILDTMAQTQKNISAIEKQMALLEKRLQLLEESSRKIQILEQYGHRLYLLQQDLERLRDFAETFPSHHAQILSLHQGDKKYHENWIAALQERIKILETQQQNLVAYEKIGNSYYELAKEHYHQKQYSLALVSIKMALAFAPGNNDYVSFLQKNWDELNLPSNMIVIPAGLAKLGQFPHQELEIASFYMDQFEVTRKEFANFVENGYKNDDCWSKKGLEWRNSQSKLNLTFDPKEDRLPMTRVNYYEAEAYSKWIGKRLPTAHEWEYSARGNIGYQFPWGNTVNSSFANCRYSISSTTLAFVDAFPLDRSPYQIIGLAGNVSEWTQTSFQNAEKQILYQVKGGSFQHLGTHTPSHFYFNLSPDQQLEYVGFRCVKDIPKQ